MTGEWILGAMHQDVHHLTTGKSGHGKALGISSELGVGKMAGDWGIRVSIAHCSNGWSAGRLHTKHI
jgi:hypothetical protein